jgi:hypothetical protein
MCSSLNQFQCFPHLRTLFGITTRCIRECHSPWQGPSCANCWLQLATCTRTGTDSGAHACLKTRHMLMPFRRHSVSQAVSQGLEAAKHFGLEQLRDSIRYGGRTTLWISTHMARRLYAPSQCFSTIKRHSRLWTCALVSRSAAASRRRWRRGNAVVCTRAVALCARARTFLSSTPLAQRHTHSAGIGHPSSCLALARIRVPSTFGRSAASCASSSAARPCFAPPNARTRHSKTSSCSRFFQVCFSSARALLPMRSSTSTFFNRRFSSLSRTRFLFQSWDRPHRLRSTHSGGCLYFPPLPTGTCNQSAFRESCIEYAHARVLINRAPPT